MSQKKARFTPSFGAVRLPYAGVCAVYMEYVVFVSVRALVRTSQQSHTNFQLALRPVARYYERNEEEKKFGDVAFK